MIYYLTRAMQFYVNINEQPLDLLSICVQIQRCCRKLGLWARSSVEFFIICWHHLKARQVLTVFVIISWPILFEVLFLSYFRSHQLLDGLWHIKGNIEIGWYSEKSVAPGASEISLKLTWKHVFDWSSSGDDCDDVVDNVCPLMEDGTSPYVFLNAYDNTRIGMFPILQTRESFIQLPFCMPKICTFTWIGYTRQQTLTFGVQCCWDTFNPLPKLWLVLKILPITQTPRRMYILTFYSLLQL